LDTERSLRDAKLEHGFYLRFDAEIRKIYHQFGELGLQDRALTEAICEKKYEQDATYLIIIQSLTRLALLPEAQN
jgi:hypothetical protein